MLIYAENFQHLDLEDCERYSLGLEGHESVKIDFGPDAVGGKRYLMANQPHPDRSEDGINISVPDSRRIVFGVLIGQDRKNWEYSGFGDGPDWVWWETHSKPMYFRLYHSDEELFRIICSVQSYKMDVSFSNYGEEGISPENGVPIDLGYMNYFEFFVDTEGAEGGAGTVKVAVNGKTLVVRENVITSAVSKWGGDPTNALSWVNKVCFGFGEDSRPDDSFDPIGPRPLHDSIYVCNEGMGYHDDFLGPQMISTFYPDHQREGDIQNFVPYYQGERTTPEEHNNSEILESNQVLDFDAEDENYLEADDSNVKEFFYTENELWKEGQEYDVHAVVHKTYAKKIYSADNDEFEYNLTPLFKASGNDTIEEFSKSVHLNDPVYKELTAIYDIVPGKAVPWTWELLNGAQFGFKTRHATNHLFIDEEFITSEGLTEE